MSKPAGAVRSFVLTGTLSGMTREQARAAIESKGHKVAGSVSKNRLRRRGDDAGLSSTVARSA